MEKKVYVPAEVSIAAFSLSNGVNKFKKMNVFCKVKKVYLSKSNLSIYVLSRQLPRSSSGDPNRMKANCYFL